MDSTERRENVSGVEVVWRERGAGPLYLHGVPNSSVMWEPFLERTGGIAPDLPGFGDSDKPPHFAYSIDGYADFLEGFVDARGLDRLTLVVHDWGAVGLALAQRRPDLVERLVVISAVPFVPGFRWHRFARAWRRPLVGELAMGFTFRATIKRLLPEELVDDVWRHFDHGTQRAILKLYRSAPPHVLAEKGKDLGAVTAPALVVWGGGDTYLPVEFADRIAEALGGEANVRVFDDASHWPWLDRPEVVDLVGKFVLAN